MTLRRRVLLVLAFVVVLAVALAFPYGPLFPWSPVHPGYAKLSLARSDVYYPAGSQLPEPFQHTDEYIVRAERFHQFPMKSRVTVVLCRDWSAFDRFMPHEGHLPAAVTLLTGTVIYITPKATEKRLDPGEFLRHEISHAALNQNQGLLNAYRMMRQQWFAEGLAVLFGEQKAFITADEFLQRSQRQELLPIIDPQHRDSAPKPFDMRYAYQAWRYFLEHLIEHHGRARFQQFMTAYLANPNDYRSLFAQTYGMSLEDAILLFQDDVRAKGWRPNPEFVSVQVGNP